MSINNLSSQIKLPKVNIGSLLEKIPVEQIEKGVKDLAKIAGDSFLKPANDGKHIFAPTVTVDFLGSKIRLKNPVEVLAEKLLGEMGQKVRSMGFNPEVIASMFAGQEIGGVTIPSLPSRVTDIAEETASTSTRKYVSPQYDVDDAVGGATQTSTKSATVPAEAGGKTSSSSSTKSSGSSSSSSKASSSSKSSGAKFALGNGLDGIAKTIEGLDAKVGSYLEGLNADVDEKTGKYTSGPFKGKTQAYANMIVQQTMQRRNELYQLLSQIMQMEHETKKQIIGNIR